MYARSLNFAVEQAKENLRSRSTSSELKTGFVILYAKGMYAESLANSAKTLAGDLVLGPIGYAYAKTGRRREAEK